MDATKQGILSAVRSILIALGAWGFVSSIIDDETAGKLVDVALIVGPLVWGIIQKFTADRKAQEAAALGVNVGKVVADATVGPTPLSTPAQAAALIETVAPSLPPVVPVVKPGDWKEP